jgi:pimeloyl-ACP methyl ester carboxylesterase
VIKQIFFGDSKITYNINGNGNTIVLVHGFLEDKSIWNNYVNTLKDLYCVISVDLPGFGDSQVIDETHRMGLMAEVVNHILCCENITRCYIVGHSMGGYVALSFAEFFEEKLVGVVMFHSHAAADDKKTKIIRERTIEIVNNNHKDYISNFIPSLFSEKNIQKFNYEIVQLTNISLKTSEEGITAALRGMIVRKDYQYLLKTLSIPLMFIIGKDDTKIPLEKLMQQISLPKLCEAIIIDKVGHMGFIEEEQLILNALISFLQRHLID